MSSHLYVPENGTELKSKIHAISSLSHSTKIALLVTMVAIGVVGFVGNIFVLRFMNTKKNAPHLFKAFSIERSLNVYIKSLALSDVLCDVLSIPSLCVQMYFDVFQDGLGCYVVRYQNILFPAITMNNLLAISIEKYLSTRKNPRTFHQSTVKKVVFLSWVVGFFLVLIPTATYRGLRFELNDTHYTVNCKYDNQYLPFRIMFLSYSILQYFIPSLIIVAINISLILNVWKRLKRPIDVQRDNGIKLTYRAARIRSIFIIIALTSAFVIPYLFYFVRVAYNNVSKTTEQRSDFEKDYIIRCVSASIGFSNSIINVIIYLVQMKDFRAYVKKSIHLTS